VTAADRAALDTALARALARALVAEIHAEQQNEPPKNGDAPTAVDTRNGAIGRGRGGRADNAQDTARFT
jgi:hypothetical protein